MALKYPTPPTPKPDKEPETILVTSVGRFPTNTPQKKGITPAKEQK